MAEFLLLPKILKILRSEAPNVRLEIQPLNHVRKLDVFTDYQLDLACGVLVDEIAHINKEPCFDFTGIVVADRRHPLMQKKLTLADYLLANHVRIKYDTGSVSTNTDNALKEIGKKRNIVVTLPHVMPILFMLKNTDLLATMPAFIPKYLLKKLELSTQPLPFKKKITRLTQTAWVRQSEKDPGLMWLRGVIKRVTQSELL